MRTARLARFLQPFAECRPGAVQAHVDIVPGQFEVASHPLGFASFEINSIEDLRILTRQRREERPEALADLLFFLG
jgi:hypothetical protein